MNKLIIISLAALVLTGCSATTRSNFCAGVAAGGAIGAPNPFAIPCILSDAADLVMKVTKNEDRKQP